MKISVQSEDFNIGRECESLRLRNDNVGALATFTGLVREMDSSHSISSLFLEHYPGMTEKSLQQILDEASERWSILDATVIHRIGELKAAEQIVFVAVCSTHRKEAFAACEYIMDFLKTRAPFWKKSREEQGDFWVEAKSSDKQSAQKWDD